ncbi:MAG: polymorphic toxin type 44 domain-containing protein [Minicystis sp.]
MFFRARAPRNRRTSRFWDHKPTITKQFGHWAYDPESNTSYCYDVWSNIHFGYIGAASGFSGGMLKNGAGAAQAIAGTSDVSIFGSEYWRRRFETLGDADFLAAYDDPKDQEAINTGIDLWNKHGENVTQDQLMDAMRASKKLCSRPGMMRC